MTAIRQISRYKAATVHLALSAAIAALTVTLMLFVWYPPPLFQAMGGNELLLLIVGVDVVIGPLITLIIFDTRKKELLFDLAVIAVLQLAALSYGVYAMHAGRPVFGVFVENRIVVVAASDIEDDALAKAERVDYRHLSQSGPQWVFADPPSDPKDAESFAFAALVGMGAQNLPKYFVPLAERGSQLVTAARPLAQLTKLSQEESGRLDQALRENGQTREQTLFVPVLTKRAFLTALIDGRDGRLLKILPIDPRASLQGDKSK